MKFPAFPFPEFESVQTIKLATSKITFVFLISTIHIYLSFVSEAFEEYIWDHFDIHSSCCKKLLCQLSNGLKRDLGPL